MPSAPPPSRLKITTGRINSRTCEWQIHAGRKWLYGGYCRTKRDALHDAAIVLHHHTSRR